MYPFILCYNKGQSREIQKTQARIRSLRATLGGSDRIMRHTREYNAQLPCQTLINIEREICMQIHRLVFLTNSIQK
jgi:hypothetical protein